MHVSSPHAQVNLATTNPVSCELIDKLSSLEDMLVYRDDWEATLMGEGEATPWWHRDMAACCHGRQCQDIVTTLCPQDLVKGWAGGDSAATPKKAP